MPVFDFTLDAVEVRVLGCLLEKEATTPEYYPLTLNALVSACNQKSNRYPVVNYGEETVREAADRLRAKGLVTLIVPSGSRVNKYAHRLAETLNLGRRELALLCTLLLRGPQTAGELHARAGRMHAFSGLDEVEAVLSRLMEFEKGPLVARLARAPGMKEPRYRHSLSGEMVEEAPANAPPDASAAASAMQELEVQVQALRKDVEELKRELEDLRKRLNGA